MAFELPTLPFPKDSTGTPYIASPDANGKYTVASGQWFKNASNLWVPVSATDPLPVKAQTELPAGTQIIGQVKLTDGTDALLVNANGSINIVPINSAGTELFTAGNPGNVQLTGSYATIDSAPVVGVKTVTTTAAELFAGASRLANRYVMIVYNESSVPVYWGPAGVTTTTGFTLLPQDSIVFQFDPTVATPIYFIAGSSASVRVVELA